MVSISPRPELPTPVEPDRLTVEAVMLTEASSEGVKSRIFPPEAVKSTVPDPALTLAIDKSPLEVDAVILLLLLFAVSVNAWVLDNSTSLIDRKIH